MAGTAAFQIYAAGIWREKSVAQSPRMGAGPQGRGNRYGRGAAQPSRCLRQIQARRSRGSGGDRIQWMKQGAAAGAALQFSQGRSAARWENWLSAKGTRSAFCKRAPSRAVKTGHRNPDWEYKSYRLSGKVSATTCAVGRCGCKQPATGRRGHRFLPCSVNLEGAVCGTEPRQGRGRRPGATAMGGGQRRRPRPVDETGSRRWRSAPIFTRGHRPPLGKLAKRKRKD